MEIEELSKYGHMRQWHPKDDRHSLFLLMKYPNTEFYKGGWGPELLHFTEIDPHIGKVGKILCTYSRYKEISEWFLKNMFKP